jgi:protein ImuA
MTDTRWVNEYRATFEQNWGRIDSSPARRIIEHIMNKRAKLAELRHSLARYGLPPDRPPLALGHAQADAVLGGGLRPGALHEVFATGWSAGGFAALLAIRVAKGKPLFWVRPDYEGVEYGSVSPEGLLELGGDPRQLILVRTRKATDALSATSDILACPHVGALLLEIEGMPKCLDLVASRRLAFAAGESGGTVIMLRGGAEAEPSAALTRWQVKSAPSHSDGDAPDDDWGNPVFDGRLIRHRLGGLGHFLMQWNSEHACFDTPDIGAVVAAPADRPAYAQERRAI